MDATMDVTIGVHPCTTCRLASLSGAIGICLSKSSPEMMGAFLGRKNRSGRSRAT